MRNLHLLDIYRHAGWERSIAGGPGDDTVGAFRIPMKTDVLRVIASNAAGWDHVSVSLVHRTPTWAEMEHVKRLFFKDDETAMQLHVPPAEHIDHHPHCLHLWRPHDGVIPRPPNALVGAPS